MIKAVNFDLGNTLIASHLHLNWKNYYGQAIAEVLSNIGEETTEARIDTGKEVLLRYNTRINYREYEVDCHTIFNDMFFEWGMSDSPSIDKAVSVFASFFLSRSELFPDSLPALDELKNRGMKIGILTNVAYGLGREYMERDISLVSDYVDALLTSVEVGFRKPHTAGFIKLAKELEVEPEECLFVGDEQADVLGANRSGMISVFLDREGKGTDHGQKYTVRTLDEIMPVING